ncbi:hypothetical protein TPHA_0D03690 [Tetrapisispora phaffii CBS 4417]|uniref:lactoylglutathione lyase n=1 Tax=Tetrapisispora phaffii (strain ATCC 24235 / CBS 4417 / NBRC 1672 / NRRL Y-8282 / UCD 70-5) TaxID=1071381 RepID=G8BT33_TETPH|nr:hypothetical protein TPHA_0D03690 [Tetrapisispora phaffii CBS 4417]CCE63004.1 hypothetical protein TPHA_0D03690 [Tetrapisispora phaffii CBS 4417]
MSLYTTKIESAQNDPSLLMNHTCYRIKDPVRSIEFYEKKLNMKLYMKKDFPDMKFSLYFLKFPGEVEASVSGDNIFGYSGVLELTHNWGTEDDPDYKVNNGNVEPHRGFGHTCISVYDIEKYCSELEAKNVVFKKKLEEGRQHNIAFILDPDGYWIELLAYQSPQNLGPKLNHTMYRIKDPKQSVDFYTNVLGMKLIRTFDVPTAKFTNYFFSYKETEGEGWRTTEGVVELCHNYGTEDDPDFHYHTGNAEPQGYGHICVVMDKPEVFCQEIENKYGDAIQWAPKFNQGKMKNIAFLKDPDGYSIEVVLRNIKL